MMVPSPAKSCREVHGVQRRAPLDPPLAASRPRSPRTAGSPDWYGFHARHSVMPLSHQLLPDRRARSSHAASIAAIRFPRATTAQEERWPNSQPPMQFLETTPTLAGQPSRRPPLRKSPGISKTWPYAPCTRVPSAHGVHSRTMFRRKGSFRQSTNPRKHKMLCPPDKASTF